MLHIVYMRYSEHLVPWGLKRSLLSERGRLAGGIRSWPDTRDVALPCPGFDRRPA